MVEDLPYKPIGEGSQPWLKPLVQLLLLKVSSMAEIPPCDVIGEGPQPLSKPPM
jgi:hypothetical protein